MGLAAPQSSPRPLALLWFGRRLLGRCPHKSVPSVSPATSEHHSLDRTQACDARTLRVPRGEARSMTWLPLGRPFGVSAHMVFTVVAPPTSHSSLKTCRSFVDLRCGWPVGLHQPGCPPHRGSRGPLTEAKPPTMFSEAWASWMVCSQALYSLAQDFLSFYSILNSKNAVGQEPSQHRQGCQSRRCCLGPPLKALQPRPWFFHGTRKPTTNSGAAAGGRSSTRHSSTRVLCSPRRRTDPVDQSLV